MSSQSLSNLHLQRTVDELYGLQKWQERTMMVFGIVALGVIGISSYYSSILGERAKFDNPSDDWQACMIQADFAAIPIASLTTTALTPTITCILSGNCADAATCLSPLLGGGLAIADAPLPSGHLLNSLSYLGIQSLVFAAGAHAAMYRALRHPSWLISTIGLCLWCLFAVFSYYTINPVFPVPNQTNATLLIALFYAADYSKFNDFNAGDNDCKKAYNWLWVYLFLLLTVAFSILVTSVIGMYAEKVRYVSKNRPHYDKLENTRVPLALGSIALCFYLLIAFSKSLACSIELESISDFNYATPADAGAVGLPLWFPTVWFPFQQPSLDIATVTYMCAFMSILRGYTIQSVSAFRLAFISALVFTIISYPAVVGGIQFYAYNKFYKFDNCWQYFEGGTTSFFGYPDTVQAKAYCNAFRLSFAGNIGLFGTMHFVTAACCLCLFKNQERDSEILEPLEDTKKRLDERISTTSNPLPNDAMGMSQPPFHQPNTY